MFHNSYDSLTREEELTVGGERVEVLRGEGDEDACTTRKVGEMLHGAVVPHSHGPAFEGLAA